MGSYNDLSIYNDNNIAFITDTRYDAQAYCWNWNKQLFVIFRGTSSPRDIRIDIDLRLVPLNASQKDDVKVHRGFLRQFNGIKNQLDDLLMYHLKTSKIQRIIFTGHSLGGALATLATYHYTSKLCNKCLYTCITFGSPKVGNKLFCLNFQSVVDINTSTRFQNIDDIVCLFPLHGAYTHVIECSRLSFKKQCIGSNPNGTKYWWNKIFYKIKMFVKQIVTSHSIDGYISALSIMSTQ